MRVTLLSRGGGLLMDAEYAQGQVELPLPDNCAAVAVSGLGRLGAMRDGWRIPPGPGAVTAFAAPGGRLPATGWQSSDHAVQLNARTLLVRGAVLVLSQKAGVAVHGQTLGQAIVPLAEVVQVSTAVQLHLSPHVQVVAVTLEAEGGRRPGDDDLAMAVDRGSLSRQPVRAAAGSRTVMLFDLTPDPDATANGDQPVIVSVHGAEDVRIVGVVGLGGSASDWGAQLNGSVPEDWVPDEALTPDGSTRIRFPAD